MRLCEIGLLVGIALACSCSVFEPVPNEEGYGLPVIMLEADDMDWSWLRAHRYDAGQIPVSAYYLQNKYTGELRNQGQSTRVFPKANYLLTLTQGTTILGYPRLKLSSQQMDKAMLRSVISASVFSRNGLSPPSQEHVSLYRNGDYAGLYLFIEPVDNLYLQRRAYPANLCYEARLDGDLSWKSVVHYSIGFDVLFSKTKDYTYLTKLMTVVDYARNDELEQKLNKCIDIERYITYIAVCVVVNHWDGFFKNYLLYLEPTTRTLKILPMDFDRDFRFPCGGPLPGNSLSKRILNHPDLREKLRQRILLLVEEEYSSERLATELVQWSEKIKAAYAADPYLVDRANLDKEVEYMRGFFVARAGFLREFWE